MKKQEWFSTWFDTSYYHILYQHRSFDEAEQFISNLLAYLKPELDAHILDLACGKGRHSFYIAKQAYQVTGVDLSAESIQWAKHNYALPNLSFDIHDMREVYKKQGFDFVFNFFTSFGYFDNNEDNLHVVQGMAQDLKAQGKLVIDFMNVHKVIKGLKEEEQLVIDGITFKIKRTFEDGFIIKTINFEDKGEMHEYYESVHALTLEDFKELFAASHLEILATFGDYDLNPYNALTSDRLIMVLKKDA